jgi:hypothetical protein
MLTGRNRADAVEWAKENYGVQGSVAMRYWHLARQKIEHDFQEVLSIALAEQVMTRRKLRSMSDDPRFVLDCLDSEAKLLGLHRYAGSIELVGAGGGPIQTIVTQEQIVVHRLVDGEAEVVEGGG